MNVTFTSGLFVTFPLHPPQRQGCWPSFLRGRAEWRPLAPWRCSCHPRMGKWWGRWLRRMAPGSVPPILARWKARDREPKSRSGLIRGQISISHCQSQRSAKANRWVLLVHPMERITLTSRGGSPRHFSHMIMTTPLRIVDISLMIWCVPLIYLVWCQPCYLLLLLLVALLCISCRIRERKKNFPCHFLQQKLLNKWAGPDLLWWSQSNTIASNCSRHIVSHHWVATAAWCGLHGFSQAVKRG